MFEPETGPYLGQMKNELSEGDYITKLASTGPKSYAYQTNNGETSVKVKGITLNTKNSLVIDYDLMKELVYGVRDSFTVYDTVFLRHKKCRKITIEQRPKTLQLTYSKRVIVEDFKTVPYGHHSL